MKGTPAIYLGRIVDKKSFRTTVYAMDGQRKVVESWEEYEAAMESGLWFATREDAVLRDEIIESILCKEACESEPFIKQKPKRKQKPKPFKVDQLEEDDGEIPHDLLDEMVFEVKD